MTKLLIGFCLMAAFGCSTNRGPASLEGSSIASDSMALGNVKANALKRIVNGEVCFDITLTAKDVTAEQAQASNWTMAWVDKNDHYHIIPVHQRVPASAPEGGAVVAPYGAYTEYKNSFTTCAPHADIGDVKALTLTPKELPYNKKDGMKLTWNN